MNFWRLCLRVVVLVGLLLVAVAALGFLPVVQTWAARKALASRPDLHGSIGSVSAGWSRIRVSDLVVERNGAVLRLPSLEAELPLLPDAYGRKIVVHRLVARGWTLDLTRARPAPWVASDAAGTRVPRSGLLASVFAGGAAAPAIALRAFQGIFSGLVLPADLALDGVDLQGTILLPDEGGGLTSQAGVGITGGGLGPGGQGVFGFSANVKFSGASAPVGAVSAQGLFRAEMDTPRTFTRFEVKVDATAVGGQLVRSVGLSGDAAATRGPDGESYVLTLARGSDQLASLTARFPYATRRLAGHWQVDLGDSDLVPFTLGRALPSFKATGEGGFDADAAFSGVHAWGGLKVAADRLGVIVPELDALGAVTLAADFDLAHMDGSIRVDRLSVSLAGAQPVAEVRALQPFEFNGRSGDLKVADPSGDLVGISVRGLPLAWLQRFLPGVKVTGGDVRGELVLRAGNGGLALRPRSPLTAGGVAMSWGGRPVAKAVDVSVFVLADYAPGGWQIQVAPLALSSSGMRILSVEARAGKLAADSRTLKAAGTWNASLAALLAQPVGAGVMAPVPGTAEGGFSASFGATREVQASVAVAASGLPKVTADFRAQVSADGRIAFSAPIRLELGERLSDVSASGTCTRAKGGRVFDVQLTSGALAFDDLMLLSAALGMKAPPVPEPASAGGAIPVARDASPIWGGLSGRLTLALKDVTLASGDLRDVGGTVQLDPGSLRIAGGRAMVGSGCGVKIDGGLAFDGRAERPYVLGATVGVTHFDSAQLFAALDPIHPPTIDGKFNAESRLAGDGANLGELLDRLQGETRLTSRGGIFRALRADVTDSIRQTPSRLSGALGTVTSLFGIKADAADAAGKIIDKSGHAVVALTDRIAEINYDQINVTATRGPDLNIHLTDFSLIAPEERLTGTGEISYAAGVPVVGQPVSLDLQLSAQGQTATLAGAVGLLRDEKDNLGYTRFVQPIHLGGTLAAIDAGQFRDVLVQAALRKAAGSLLDKLLGK